MNDRSLILLQVALIHRDKATMILAMLFLPAALVVITIAMPMLLFLISVAATFIFTYQGVLFAYADCKESWKLLLEETSTQQVLLKEETWTYRMPNNLCCRSRSPFPPLETVLESSSSFRGQNYMKVHRDFDFTPRRRVRFA